MDWDALERAGLCECGAALDDHPPLPKPRPLSSWMGDRENNRRPEMRRVPSAAEQPRILPKPSLTPGVLASARARISRRPSVYVVRAEREARGVAAIGELGRREREVYDLASAGGDRETIAYDLQISPKAVDVHLWNIRRKGHEIVPPVPREVPA